MRDFKSKKKILGDKVPLKTIEGNEWIRPKRFSVSQQDEYNQIQQSLLKASGIKVSRMQEFEKAKEEGIENIPESVYETAMEISAMPSTQITRFLLLNGIGEHSFVDDPAGSNKVDEKLVDDIMDCVDVALEIASIVQAFNAPLAKTTSETSETSPNGSTKEQNSTKGTPSPTIESPLT